MRVARHCIELYREYVERAVYARPRNFGLKGRPFGSRPRDTKAERPRIMAEVLLNPEQTNSHNTPVTTSGTNSRSNKKRLNWLTWMRKSIGSIDRNNKKMCPCGFYHNNQDSSSHQQNHQNSDWPVFTMSQSGKLIFLF